MSWTSVTLCPSRKFLALPGPVSVLQDHLSFLASWIAGPGPGPLLALPRHPCTWRGSVSALPGLCLHREAVGPSAFLGYCTCGLC